MWSSVSVDTGNTFDIMTQSFELLSCERVEMKYSRFFWELSTLRFWSLWKKKEGRVLGAERLVEQVAHLSIWYFKNFNAKLEPSSNEKLESYWMCNIIEIAVDVFFLIWLGRIKIEKFYIRFYTPKAPICRQARVRGDFEYWKMKFLFKTILPGRQRSRGCVRGVVMVNIFLRLWRGDIGLEKKEKINLICYFMNNSFP